MGGVGERRYKLPLGWADCCVLARRNVTGALTWPVLSVKKVQHCVRLSERLVRLPACWARGEERLSGPLKNDRLLRQQDAEKAVLIINVKKIIKIP